MQTETTPPVTLKADGRSVEIRRVRNGYIVETPDGETAVIRTAQEFLDLLESSLNLVFEGSPPPSSGLMAVPPPPASPEGGHVAPSLIVGGAVFTRPPQPVVDPEEARKLKQQIADMKAIAAQRRRNGGGRIVNPDNDNPPPPSAEYLAKWGPRRHPACGHLFQPHEADGHYCPVCGS